MRNHMWLLAFLLVIPCCTASRSPIDPKGHHVTGNLPASVRDIYFCADRVKICERFFHDSRAYSCATGTWTMTGNVITANITRSYGRRGVGDPLPGATAGQDYADYEDYRETVSREIKITDWDEMVNDRSGTWSVQKYTGACE